MGRSCEIRELGRVEWGEAFAMQQKLVARRKAGDSGDCLLLVEHPHVVTMGRNGQEKNLLASPQTLSRSGIGFYETDRGGDVTYHGPGQLVGYPILDLRDWKRDVHEYVRAIEQALIDTLADFGIAARRVQGLTGVWVEGRKIAAIGIHISRWVTSHGFALNVNPDLSYFQFIVPCGLTQPVTSMAALGALNASLQSVSESFARHFQRVFHYDLELAEIANG